MGSFHAPRRAQTSGAIGLGASLNHVLLHVTAQRINSSTNEVAVATYCFYATLRRHAEKSLSMFRYSQVLH